MQMPAALPESTAADPVPPVAFISLFLCSFLLRWKKKARMDVSAWPPRAATLARGSLHCRGLLLPASHSGYVDSTGQLAAAWLWRRREC